jgi:hypothetical protein
MVQGARAWWPSNNRAIGSLRTFVCMRELLAQSGLFGVRSVRMRRVVANEWLTGHRCREAKQPNWRLQHAGITPGCHLEKVYLQLWQKPRQPVSHRHRMFRTQTGGLFWQVKGRPGTAVPLILSLPKRWISLPFSTVTATSGLAAIGAEALPRSKDTLIGNMKYSAGRSLRESRFT